MKKAVFISLLMTTALGSAFYQYKKEKKFIKTFPIFFSSKFHPYIKTSINNISDHFILDTGGSFYCQLDPKISHLFEHAEFFKTRKTIDINNGVANEDEFFLKNIRFLDIYFSHFYFFKGDDNFLIRELIESPSSKFKEETITEEKAGSYIGHKVLKYFNVFFDFRNKKCSFYLPDSPFFLHSLFKFIFSSKKISIDYLSHAGVICQVSTDAGEKKFLIDTGSPVTIIKGLINSDKIIHKFIIGSKNYGPILTKEFEAFGFEDFDGILGMDFFYDKSLYINFNKKVIWIN